MDAAPNSEAGTLAGRLTCWLGTSYVFAQRSPSQTCARLDLVLAFPLRRPRPMV